MVMRASALQIIPNQLFGEVSGATICVVHHNNIGKLEECIKRKKVVYCILGMACNHSDNDCISRIEPEDLLGKDARVGTAEDYDLGQVHLQSLHFGKGGERAVSSRILFVSLDEFCNGWGSHGAYYKLGHLNLLMI